jgi:imidazoleglycerol phosphate synthase glutamine amidotransferase subunit HisH
MKLVLIKYNAGNIQSVLNALSGLACRQLYQMIKKRSAVPIK